MPYTIEITSEEIERIIGHMRSARQQMRTLTPIIKEEIIAFSETQRHISAVGDLLAGKLLPEEEGPCTP